MCFNYGEKSENNGTGETGLVTPTPEHELPKQYDECEWHEW